MDDGRSKQKWSGENKTHSKPHLQLPPSARVPASSSLCCRPSGPLRKGEIHLYQSVITWCPCADLNTCLQMGSAMQHLLSLTPYSEISGSNNIEWDASQAVPLFFRQWSAEIFFPSFHVVVFFTTLLSYPRFRYQPGSWNRWSWRSWVSIMQVKKGCRSRWPTSCVSHRLILLLMTSSMSST